MNFPPKSKLGFFHASSLLFFISLVANLFNYGFHAVASRSLGPAEYGALVSLLALLSILSIPSQALQMAVAKQVIIEETGGHPDRIPKIILTVLLHMLWTGIIIWVVLILGHVWLQNFFHLHTSTPILTLGLVVLITLSLPIIRGTLQGLHDFQTLGINLFLDSLFRLGFGLFFFFLGWGVTGGITAAAASGALAFFAGYFPIYKKQGPLTPSPGNNFIKSLYQFSLPVSLILGSFMVLSGLDMILVKHYLAPELAGYYAAGSLVGKAFLILPVAIAQVLFSKTSTGFAKLESTHGFLWQSLGLTAGVLFIGILLNFFLAPVIILSLFGKQFLNPTTLFLVKIFPLIMLPLSLIYLFLQYCLAVHKSQVIPLLIFDIFILFLGLITFHASINEILVVLGINHFLLLAGVFVLVGRSFINRTKG